MRTKHILIRCILIINLFGALQCLVTDFPPERIAQYREKVKTMFYHAYNGYLNYAYPLDELKPLSCTGMNTWGSFSLTLVDALDTLLIMGNETEFLRAVDLILANVDVDANVNVSVFETNIRVVGGLLSAHMMSGRVKDMDLHSGWPCAGPLLDLAEKFAQKLLPAFNTETGMPYGTVNLRYGVDKDETPITCTAGVGTFILEFGTLSRLTGNPIYERVALRAMKSLWGTKSAIGLVGNHINVQTGIWTATDAGIGAGVDSYFEYLAKGALLFQRPLFMYQFNEYTQAINKYIRKDDWFMWVSMTRGTVNFPVFQSLEAYWPGVLALVGQVEDAARIMLTYDQVNKQYGVPPEFYNLPNREAVDKRSGYPLRPEIVESMMYLYKATDDPHYLHMAASIVEAIEANTKTSCGYATIKDINKKTLEDRMESFFLAETTKYLYLLFDPENFIHSDGLHARVFDHPAGECVMYAGGWIFNTEAHPIDPAALYCCGAKRAKDEILIQKFKENIDFVSFLDLNDPFLKDLDKKLDEDDLHEEVKELKVKEEHPDDVENELRELEQHMWEHEEKIRREKEEDDNNIQVVRKDDKADEYIKNDGEKNSDDGTAEDSRREGEYKEEMNNEVHVDEQDEEVDNMADGNIFVQGVDAQDVKETRRRRKGKTRRISTLLKGPNDVASEKEDRELVKRRIKDLVESLERLDDAAGQKDEPSNLLKLLGTLGAEYSNLLKASTKLQALASSRRSQMFEKVKKELMSNRVQQLVPINEVVCQDCCVKLDAQYDSVALRQMLNMIYSKHVYAKSGFNFVPGPICREDEKPDLTRNYNSTSPDIAKLESEEQALDAVDHFNFGTFAYNTLSKEHHELLSSPPRPFLSLLMGMGQVLPRAAFS
ncbi:unnamed protein product [Bursaphelenchus okinawaensis]|uniref:alpha-1,2-Mannosidase n=1 Tax=Bursaphelenchus okinawaensis TaxID=465554 RepID=A0A811LC10_9BILA|nr:unnamed protein product [Bursaphelenchus okinawaensis]CAG9120112.1 unnamed protein product [Bursaphelenchus okinawaensis]